MEKSSTLYVGLDDYKGSVEIATADAGRDGEVRHLSSIGGELTALDRALRKLTSKGQPLHVVHEDAPLGFVIWRHLTAQGLTCEVVAPSSIPKRSDDRAGAAVALGRPDSSACTWGRRRSRARPHASPI